MDDRFKLPAKQFLQGLYTDNGSPSSSRVLSAVLSIGCLVIIAVLFRYLLNVDAARLAVWLPNAPYVIVALAVFAQSPYGMNRFSSMFKQIRGAQTDEHKEDSKG